MDKSQLNDAMVKALCKSHGIVDARPVFDEDRQKILEIEEDSEKRGLMGLGKVFNSGLREVLGCDRIYVALTSMDFDWGERPSLVLKKGDHIVGEEVRDEEARSRLADQEDVWFMHDHFVIYKNRVSFPKDLLDKTCYFDTPCLPAEWCTFEDDRFDCQSIIYANPAAPSDVYLKGKYFQGYKEEGLGTILVGLHMSGDITS
jgi:hypothetical protein